MATHIHIHRAPRPASTRTADAKTRTHDCGCGGHSTKDDDVVKCWECGERFPAGTTTYPTHRDAQGKKCPESGKKVEAPSNDSKAKDATLPLPTSTAGRAEYKAALVSRIKQLEAGGVRGQQAGDLAEAQAQLKKLETTLTGDSAGATLGGEAEALAAGAPVNELWLKLDRMGPEDLRAFVGDTRGTRDSLQGKTDTIMGYLRSKFSAFQIDSWAKHY